MGEVNLGTYGGPSGDPQSCRDARRIRQPGDDRADGVAQHLDVTWLTGALPWLALFQRWLAEAAAADPRAQRHGRGHGRRRWRTRHADYAVRGAAAPVSRSSPATSRPKGLTLAAHPNAASLTFPGIALGQVSAVPSRKSAPTRDAGVLGFVRALADLGLCVIAVAADCRSWSWRSRRGHRERFRASTATSRSVPPHWGDTSSMWPTRSSGRVAPTACTTVSASHRRRRVGPSAAAAPNDA